MFILSLRYNFPCSFFHFYALFGLYCWIESMKWRWFDGRLKLDDIIDGFSTAAKGEKETWVHWDKILKKSRHSLQVTFGQCDRRIERVVVAGANIQQWKTFWPNINDIFAESPMFSILFQRPGQLLLRIEFLNFHFSDFIFLYKFHSKRIHTA